MRVPSWAFGCGALGLLFVASLAFGAWSASWIILHWIHGLSTEQLDRGLLRVGALLLLIFGGGLLALALARIQNAVASGGPAPLRHPSAGSPASDRRRPAATSPADASGLLAGPPEPTPGFYRRVRES